MEVSSEGVMEVKNRFKKCRGEGRWKEVVGRERISEFKILGLWYLFPT